MKKAWLLVILFAIGCATKPSTEEATKFEVIVEKPQKELPTGPDILGTSKPKKLPIVLDVPGVEVLKHTYYTVYYDTNYKLARHVTYRLKRGDLATRTGKRKDNFKIDPMLKERDLPYYPKAAYGKTTEDRKYAPGHLAPAADFARSQEAMNESFYMSNMVPQEDEMNSPTWVELEDQVRQWACGEERITVLTGTVIGLRAEKFQISTKAVEIPAKTYKVVIDETPPRKAIGFLYSQKDGKKVKPVERVVQISDIEREAGLQFSKFVRTPKALEFEKFGKISDWKNGNKGKDCPQALKQLGSKILAKRRTKK